MKVYLAGPDVFLADAAAVLAEKKERCRAAGLTPLAPLDGQLSAAEGTPAGAAIFQANRDLMDQADAGLFNLSPFRGPGADAGTVFELGYLFARGRPVFGYTSDPSFLAERTARLCGVAGAGPDRVDADGTLIEDFGMRDNLMIDGALAASTGVFVARPGGGLAAWDAFRACLQALQRYRVQRADQGPGS